MLKRALISFLVFMLSAALCVSQTQAPDAEGHAWWQNAVFYEVYPRSFADSNNDGTGDLKGITSKMHYLHDLGVDAIWITPCFPSPQVDVGYDVSDYENIDPTYGTLTDFDHMVKEGREKGVRIILDFVLNHTSDQHAWFKDSASSLTSLHRDWYIWRDGRGPNQPPNNWISLFGGSAWKFDEKTGQYYYHFFYPEQPDLNWHNPAVEKAMLSVTSWWYQRGVSGFRLDAVDTLFEDPALHDNPTKPGMNKLGDPNMDDVYNTKLPELHDVLRKLRAVADESHAVLIGETPTSDIDQLKAYYGANNNELQMPMDFMFTYINKLDPAEFRRQIAAVDAAGGWPVYVLGNHDIPRSYNRYGDGVHNDQIAKMMAAFYLTLRGTPIMYYGEEIGMENNDPERKEDVKDPIGKLGWPAEKGRDGERTPMQWKNAPNAGFSQTTPWLPVPASYNTHNVETELKNPDSILNFYKRILALRHTNPVLLDGAYVPLNQDNPQVLSYLRTYQGKAVLVVLNMSSAVQKITFDFASQGFAAAKLRPLAVSESEVTDAGVSLQPFGAFVGELIK
jgi:alpha-glucosidase